MLFIFLINSTIAFSQNKIQKPRVKSKPKVVVEEDVKHVLFSGGYDNDVVSLSKNGKTVFWGRISSSSEISLAARIPIYNCKKNDIFELYYRDTTNPKHMFDTSLITIDSVFYYKNTLIEVVNKKIEVTYKIIEFCLDSMHLTPSPLTPSFRTSHLICFGMWIPLTLELLMDSD